MSAVSYNLDGAAAATGISVDVIRRATRSGDLPVHYPRVDGKPIARPLIRAADLDRWVNDGPTERAS